MIIDLFNEFTISWVAIGIFYYVFHRGTFFEKTLLFSCVLGPSAFGYDYYKEKDIIDDLVLKINSGAYVDVMSDPAYQKYHREPVIVNAIRDAKENSDHNKRIIIDKLISIIESGEYLDAMSDPEYIKHLEHPEVVKAMSKAI